MVREYGVGYIKMDYNIEPGIGTELYAESVGQGMMEHEKTYLNWLDEIFALYPAKEAVPFSLQDNVLRVWLKKPVMARLFVLE